MTALAAKIITRNGGVTIKITFASVGHSNISSTESGENPIGGKAGS